jgi:hypothetical protein
MSMSVSGASSPDIVQLLMMRKALSAEQTHNAQLLASLPQQPATAAPGMPASSTGTFYL